MTTAPGTEAALSFEFAASLGISIDGLTNELRQARKRAENIAQLIHPFTIPPMAMTITGSAGSGTGTLNLPNILGPQTGQYWDVHRISCTGFSAGTVSVYLNQNNADLVAVFSSAGVLLNGKAQIILGGNDNLYFSAASATAASGYITISIAGTEIAAPLIGEYLS